MKIENYSQPHSSFLSLEKDMEIITNRLIKNDRLQKLLYYPTADCLTRPSLNDDQVLDLFRKHIKMVPKLYVDSSVLTYLIVSFDSFTPNFSNPEFRDNLIEFDIICHFDQWKLDSFSLRPYKIAAEIDTMFNERHLTGIGDLHFAGANQVVLTDEFAGLCLQYATIHGGEDTKNPLNPLDAKQIPTNYDIIFNNK